MNERIKLLAEQAIVERLTIDDCVFDAMQLMYGVNVE